MMSISDKKIKNPRKIKTKSTREVKNAEVEAEDSIFDLRDKIEAAYHNPAFFSVFNNKEKNVNKRHFMTWLILFIVAFIGFIICGFFTKHLLFFILYFICLTATIASFILVNIAYTDYLKDRYQIKNKNNKRYFIFKEEVKKLNLTHNNLIKIRDLYEIEQKSENTNTIGKYFVALCMTFVIPCLFIVFDDLIKKDITVTFTSFFVVFLISPCFSVIVSIYNNKKYRAQTIIKYLEIMILEDVP